MKKISFVIVNYNGEKVIESCLRSVFASENIFFDVIVVDNASQDKSIPHIKALFPKVHYILKESNTGFADGSNTGIRFALDHGADFVFLLNNDASIEKDTLSLLLRYAQEDARGIFSPFIRSSQNSQKVWFSGGKIHWFRMRATHHDSPQGISTPLPTEYLSGCALLIPKRAFFDVGLLDEDYFLYYEDVDWSLRARRAGYSLWVIPQAKAFHSEQSETRNLLKIYFLVLSGMIFFQKNAIGWKRLWWKGYLPLRILKNSLDRFFHLGDPAVTEKVHHAYADFQNNTPLHYYRSLRKK